MSKGIVLFAHNNRQIDYVKLALLSARLAIKHLKVPASLITDESTIAWSKESNVYQSLTDVFENIIIDEIDTVENYRILHDGTDKDKIPFKNTSRFRIWDLTPYDRTLLIDSDFLIFSDTLSNYWDVDEDFLISSSIRDMNDQDRMMHYDRYISEAGVKLLWATTVMFTKNQNTKMLFNFVEHIYENYNMYAEIYRYDNRVYRNDISFSLTNHILQGFTNSTQYFLPPVLSTIDKDLLIDVENGKLKFLINQTIESKYITTAIDQMDIHVMNKQSIIRNFDKLMELT
jgi:hypothetical protein